MFSSEEGDKVVVEDEGQINLGISHIIVSFFATLIGSILGFYLSQR